jgi:hypothetical protein
MGAAWLVGWLAAALTFSGVCAAQVPGGIQQYGSVTAGHCTSWKAAGIVQDGGASCGAASGITIDTTTITGGTSGRTLYDNGGTIGETALGTTATLNGANFLFPPSTNSMFVGVGAGNSSTTGAGNMAIGYQAGIALTAPGMGATPQADTIVGYQAGYHLTTGGSTVLLGYQAGFNLTGNGQGVEDSVNTFLGTNAGYTTTTGLDNVFIGEDAGALNVTGNYNTYVGTHAGHGVLGSQNTIIGHSGGDASVGGNASDNIMIGAGVGTYIDATGGGSNGSFNVLIGDDVAGEMGFTGFNNVVNGFQAGASLTGGSQNGFFGYQAGYANTSGSYNIYFGPSAGLNGTTGNGNVEIGYQAGIHITGGADNILIGFQVSPPGDGSSALMIGQQAVMGSLSSPYIWGGFGTSPSIAGGGSSFAFLVNVGTGGTADTGIVGFNFTAPTGWACDAVDTSNAASFVTVPTPLDTSRVTLTNYSRTSGLETAWTASDVIAVKCNAY